MVWIGYSKDNFCSQNLEFDVDKLFETDVIPERIF